MISKLEVLEEKIEGEDLRTGFYCQLVIMVYKIKWLFFIIFVIIQKCKESNAAKQAKKEEPTAP